MVIILLGKLSKGWGRVCDLPSCISKSTWDYRTHFRTEWMWSNEYLGKCGNAEFWLWLFSEIICPNCFNWAEISLLTLSFPQKNGSVCDQKLLSITPHLVPAGRTPGELWAGAWTGYQEFLKKKRDRVVLKSNSCIICLLSEALQSQQCVLKSCRPWRSTAKSRVWFSISQFSDGWDFFSTFLSSPVFHKCIFGGMTHWF